MYKTTDTEGTERKLAVDIVGLQKLLSSGRATAEKIAEASGASIKVGRRRLYNVAKIEKYLDSLAEQ